MNHALGTLAGIALATVTALAAPQYVNAADGSQGWQSTTLAFGTCETCGRISSVTPYKVKGKSSGVGIVAGAVGGGLLGHTMGGGNGKTLLTIAGAGGGAYAGNAIERNMNSTTRYKVVVRMNNGNTRVFHTGTAAWRPGDRVRVDNGRLLSDG